MVAFTRTFPDAIVGRDGILRLVSVDAKEWVYANTTLKDHCDQSTIPDKIWPQAGLTDLMSQDGLLVRRQRQAQVVVPIR